MFVRESYCVACVLLIYTLPNFLVSPQNAAAKSNISKEGESILDCGEISNLAEMARCLTTRFAAVKLKSSSATSASGNYGYPFRVAPTLPPFLRHEEDHPPSSNSIDEPFRRVDGQPNERIQAYSQPEYRNFLDLDSAVRNRAVEYRPVFQMYSSIPVEPRVNNIYYTPQIADYYSKPVKTHSRDYARRRKLGKVNVTPNSQVVYQHSSYQHPAKYDRSRITVDAKKQYPKSPTYKYNSGYISDSQYTKGNTYETEYYVPANSPIMGDIRRSLLDYTGARDIMEDEPDYLSSAGIRRFRVEEVQQDYYPFRRSDVNIKDFETHESKQVSDTHRKSH